MAGREGTYSKVGPDNGRYDDTRHGRPAGVESKRGIVKMTTTEQQWLRDWKCWKNSKDPLESPCPSWTQYKADRARFDYEEKFRRMQQVQYWQEEL